MKVEVNKLVKNFLDYFLPGKCFDEFLAFNFFEGFFFIFFFFFRLSSFMFSFFMVNRSFLSTFPFVKLGNLNLNPRKLHSSYTCVFHFDVWSILWGSRQICLGAFSILINFIDQLYKNNDAKGETVWRGKLGTIIGLRFFLDFNLIFLKVIVFLFW